MRGRVHLVGAGPGDPDLLTVKAARLLAEADTVVHDRLVHPAVLALARTGARLVYVGKEGDGESARQEDIEALLVAHARLGRVVVRLKGGDPFVFGRGAEEALALEAAGIPYEVVPGVSSGIAVPAAAGIPVTHRGLARSVTFATARGARGEAPPDWEWLARAETLVLFMAVGRIEESAGSLIAAGRGPDTPAAVVEAGTWERQRVVEATLGGIAAAARQADIGSPGLLVVGDVVALRRELPTLADRVAPARVRAAGGRP